MKSIIRAALCLLNGCHGKPQKPLMRATAIVTNAQNHSALECWQFTKPATVSGDTGTSGAATFIFPNTTDAVYTVIPPQFDGGIHTAPVPQVVVVLSGLSHVTLPVPIHNNRSLDEVWFMAGGANTLILALDTTGSGHISTYPTDQETVLLQMPLLNESVIPAHEVVSVGPCHFDGKQDQMTK